MPVKFDDLVAGGAGAIDEALFGLPEFALKNLGQRKAVEDYIKQHETAYRIGEGIGTVGSMFIPVPGVGLVKAAGAGAKAAKTAKAIDTGVDIARGADKAIDIARAAKAADTAADIAKGIKTGTEIKKSLDFGKLATRGALSGAAEAGVRGVTSEKSPSEILADIRTGALFGAGGGVLGGAISRNLPRYAGEGAKAAEKAYLGTTDLSRREALSFLKDVAGPGAKGIGKYKSADAARKELVRVGKEIGAHIPGKMDDAILKHAELWNKLDDVVEKAMPDIRGSDLYTAALGKLDLDALYKEFTKEQVDQFLKETLEAGVNRSGLANSRKFLADLIEGSYGASTIKNPKTAGTQRMQREIAKSLRSGVDEIVMDTAKSAGLDIDFAKLKRDYLPMRAIAESAAKADIVPLRVNTGSPTMEKLAMSGAGTALGFSQGDDLETRLKNAAIGGIGGFAAKQAIGKLATKGIAAGAPLAGLAEAALEKAAPEVLEKAGATIGGQAASVIARKAIEEAAPETPEQTEAATTAAVSGDTPAYMSRIMNKMEAYARANGVDPESEEFRKFAGEVYAATGGFQPEKIGVILYPDSDSQAAYLKALTVSRGLREAMPGATTKKSGLINRESDEERIAREAAADKLASVVGDVAKSAGSEAAAKKSLTKILESNATPERKAELVKTLLSAYGVAVDEIESLGVV